MKISAEVKKQILKSSAWALLVVLFLSMPMAGFMAHLLVLWLILWLPYAAYLYLKKPESRVLAAAVSAIWVTALLLSIGVNWARHLSVRADADKFVSMIEQFHVEHQRYPDSLDEARISRAEMSDKLGLSSYLLKDGSPVFFYQVTYIVFDTWFYDFTKKEWVYVE
jgi:hypothetical protein